MESLTIEGEKFLGNFKAKWEYDYFWSSGGYSEYKYCAYWYEGTGIIENKETAEKYALQLKTEHFKVDNRNKYLLEDFVVDFGQKNTRYADYKQPIVVKDMYKKIVDLSLAEMFEQAKKSGEAIPAITPKKIKYDDLVKFGYIYGPK